MNDNGLPPLPQSAGDQGSGVSDQGTTPAVATPVDNTTLPPLPVPGDTMKSSDTVSQESPVTPVVSDTVTQEPPVTQVTPPPTTEPEKPKKKSNMKVVAGVMIALFLVGSAITSLVMFPNFRGDIRPKARDIEEVEQYMEQQTINTVELQAQATLPPTDQQTPDQNVPQDPTSPPSNNNNSSNSEPPQPEVQGARCPNGDFAPDGDLCNCSPKPASCYPPTTATATITSECTGTQTRCVGGYLDLCSGGQFYSSQRPCSDPTGTVTGAPGVGGSGGGGTRECVPNQCHRREFGKRDGSMCDANGNNTGVWCDMGDTGEGTGEINTCGCVDGEVAGQSGPYMCWVKNGSTGAFIRQLGATITKSGCKGSGAPSVTTTVTATVTTGGGSSSGGSSSSSGGGSSSSSSGGVAPMCVETRVYLKKADGTFDTVATPVSQLAGKIKLNDVIRLAIRGNLANFTKGRFIIKKDAVVLETKETTTKNNLPGDPATFEFVYDYTVASGGSYSIEGAVWR